MSTEDWWNISATLLPEEEATSFNNVLNRKISQDLNQNVSLPVIMMCLQGPLVLHVCYALVTQMLYFS